MRTRAGRDWLADRRTEAAAEAILDAAERLFADHDPNSVGMREIAQAAGCSRATLYRYFENREALHSRYVQRWADALAEQLAERLTGIDDPQQRLVTGITESLAMVRANPALKSWFAGSGHPIGAELADRSESVTTMVTAFLAGLGPAGADAVQRRSRWVVRVLTSLLISPGRDAADEHAMLMEFVVPVVLSVPPTASPPNVPPGSR